MRKIRIKNLTASEVIAIKDILSLFITFKPETLVCKLVYVHAVTLLKKVSDMAFFSKKKNTLTLDITVAIAFLLALRVTENKHKLLLGLYERNVLLKMINEIDPKLI